MKSTPKDNVAVPSWRDVLPVHAAADLFPMMSGPEIEALAADIKENGLLSEIVLWSPDKDYYLLKKGGKRKCAPIPLYLLDGRNRLDALQALGLIEFDPNTGVPLLDVYTPTFNNPVRVVGPDEDPWTYVTGANVLRRHLTAEQKRDVIATLLKAKPEQSNRQIAVAVKADHKTVATVRDNLEARGEIPHVAIITDTKGRQQPVKKRQTIAGYFAEQQAKETRDVDDSSNEESGIEDEIDGEDPQNYVTAYLLRADQALRFASYSGPVPATDEMIAFAHRVAAAWSKLAQQLEKSSNSMPDMPEFLRRTA